MTIAALLMLLALPVLLALSAFFSGSETALFSLTRHQQAQLAQAKSLPAATITTLLRETRALLITLLLGNMTINVLYFVISSVLLIRLHTAGVSGPLTAGASVLPLLILILFGEVLPKLAAAQIPVTFAKFASVPLLLVHRLLTPVRVASSVLVIGPLARLIAPSTRPPNLSPQELDSLLSLSQTQGVIDPQEEQLLQQVFALGQLKVRDLMIPRVDIRAFDLDDDPAHLVQLIHRTRLRHVPVYRGDLDHIQGLIYSRQVLLNPPRTALQLNKLVRQVRYVPQMQRADQLLVEMRKTGTTIAIAVDEYGGTAGLITLEDVVEHMVGDIAGEYERNSEPQVASIAPGVWRVDADLSVHEWSDFFGHNREVQGAAALELVSTLGGLVMALLGRLPKPGDHVTVGNVVITVETMKQKRIETLRIELREPANKTPDSSTEP